MKLVILVTCRWPNWESLKLKESDWIELCLKNIEPDIKKTVTSS